MMTPPSGGISRLSMTENQTIAPNDFVDNGTSWEDLGYVTINSWTLSVKLSNYANGTVIADVIRFEKVATPGSIVNDTGSNFVSYIGTWQFDTNTGGYNNDEHWIPAGDGSAKATWTFSDIVPGRYRVLATWVPGSGLATNAPFTLLDGNALLLTTTVNQTLAPNEEFADGVWWKQLAYVTVTNDSFSVQLANNADATVVADAIRIERITYTSSNPINDFDPTLFDTTGGWQSDTNTGGFNNDLHWIPAGDGSAKATWTYSGLAPGWYRVSTTWVPGTGLASNAPFTLYEDNAPLGTVRVNQQIQPSDLSQNGIPWKDLGWVRVSSGVLKIQLANNADATVVADAVRALKVEPFLTEMVDDGDPAFSTVGTWIIGTGAGCQNDQRWAATGTGNVTATWTFSGLAPGQYRVSATWAAASSNASNSPFTLYDNTTSLGTFRVNQQATPSDLLATGRAWKDLSTVTVNSGTLVVKLSNDAEVNKVVLADAIRVEKVKATIDDGDATFSTSGSWTLATGIGYQNDQRSAPGVGTNNTATAYATWIFDGLAPGRYVVSATWAQNASNATNSPFSMYDGDGSWLTTILVNQQSAPNNYSENGAWWNFLDGVVIVQHGRLYVQLANNATLGQNVVADAIHIQLIG